MKRGEHQDIERYAHQERIYNDPNRRRDQRDLGRNRRIRIPNPISAVQQDFDGLVAGEREASEGGLSILDSQHLSLFPNERYIADVKRGNSNGE